MASDVAPAQCPALKFPGIDRNPIDAVSPGSAARSACFAADTVAVVIEPVRIGWKDAEAALGNIATIEIGWRWRQTEIRITRIAVGPWDGSRFGWSSLAGAPEAPASSLGFRLGCEEALAVAGVGRILAGDGSTEANEFLVDEQPAAVALDPDVAQEPIVAVGVADISLEDNGCPGRRETGESGRRFAEVALRWLSIRPAFGRIDSDQPDDPSALRGSDGERVTVDDVDDDGGFAANRRRAGSRAVESFR